MAPLILSSLQNLTSKILSIIPSCPSGSAESSMAEEIEKLRNLVSKIQATVVDAEEKDVTDESVKLRLFDLRQVAYDAENILNDFNYELLRVEVERKVQVNNQKRKFEVIDSTISPTFDDSILIRIKKVIERFEEMRQNWVVLSLSDVDGVRKTPTNTRPPSSSFMNSTGIFGRHDYKTRIIHTMLDISECVSDNFTVISILSMGGMGKTTLAKLVYNDEMVERHFDMKSWVWVSETFDEMAISRSILESIVGRPCNFLQLDYIQKQLKENMTGKRFLLVLDDLWNEDQTRWDIVLGPLLYGARGSCILITTRNSIVAKVGRTNLLIPLGGLPKNDSWDLFCHYAFNGVDASSLPQNLVAIGQKIVQKCNGVPLLIRILGSHLANKMEEDAWEYILSSDVWELEECKTSIIPMLKLSYDLLPSHLKPCFTYCAVFPKGYVFELENLVHLWLAQGFITKRPRKQIEEVGQMYACDLLERSFFQCLSATSSTKRLKVHDLMHDLAQAITCEEILVVQNEQLDRVCDKKYLRHLTIIVKKKGCVLLERCLHGLSLKSLTIIGSHKANFCLEENIFDNPCVLNLHVLDLYFWASYKVPNSISNLKHLRYLGLSGQELPDSICDLYHLETLNLRKTIQDLPTNIDRLINLRHLLLDPWHTLMIPKGIGNLTNIQSMPFFAVSTSNKEASLRELKKLNNLRGKLHICNLDSTMTETSSDANLSGKKYLNSLVLSFRNELVRTKEEKDILTKILTNLKPHDNIQQIKLECYGGEQLPSCFQEPSFTMLTNLILKDCINCNQLPAFGQLPNLKHLKLESFSNLEHLGSLGNESNAFPSLEVLFIYDMPHLKTWYYGVESRWAFPHLREIHLSFCESLIKFQLPMFSPLEKLNIGWCHSLKTILGLKGSWSVIAQWKSLLDPPKGYDDENLSMLEYKSTILGSNVLKLQKDSETENSHPAPLILTIIGCRSLQNSYLTCEAAEVRIKKSSTEEIYPSAVGANVRSRLRNLQDFIISGAELEPQLLSTSPTNHSVTTKNLHCFLLRYNTLMINRHDRRRDPSAAPLHMPRIVLSLPGERLETRTTPDPRCSASMSDRPYGKS